MAISLLTLISYTFTCLFLICFLFYFSFRFSFSRTSTKSFFPRHPHLNFGSIDFSIAPKSDLLLKSLISKSAACVFVSFFFWVRLYGFALSCSGFFSISEKYEKTFDSPMVTVRLFWCARFIRCFIQIFIDIDETFLKRFSSAIDRICRGSCVIDVTLHIQSTCSN